jgi:hypothetical protein
MDNLTPLHQLALRHEMVMTTEAYLFQPRDAYRMHYEAVAGGPGQPEYPPPGAWIDYYLAGEPSSEVAIEITDGKGATVRTLSSLEPVSDAASRGGGGGPSTGSEQGRRGGDLVPLPKRPWHNRVRWDLRYAGTPGLPGPLVAPGTYQVRLAVGEWTQSRPIEVRVDPRVAAAGVTQVDLQEQVDLLLKLGDAVADARALAVNLQGARDTAKGDAARATSIQALVDRLVTANIVYPTPMLIDQLSNIARMAGQADQKPGRDAFQRHGDLMKEFAAIKAAAAKLGIEGRQQPPIARRGP